MEKRAQRDTESQQSAALDRSSNRRVVRPTAPFVLRHTLNRLAVFRASPIDRRIEDDSVTFALSVCGRPLLVTVGTSPDTRGQANPAIDPQPPTADPAVGTELRLTLDSDAPLTPAAWVAAGDRLRFHLGLDEDLTGLYRTASDDPAFAPVLSALHGFHPVKHTTPFEAAVWAVVQQRTPNSFAFETMKLLTRLLAPAIERRGAHYRPFPEPHAFLESRAALLEATNNTRKVDRLVPLAEAFAVADETFLRTAPYGEVASWLQRIHGVGRWSSDYVLLRGLGRNERTPWSDTGLLEAISRVYTGGFAISRGSAREIAERYGWDQGLWAHYLKVFAFSHGTNY